MTAHNLQDPKYKALSGIFQNGKGINPHLLLSKQERLRVAIRKTSNTISSLRATGNSIQQIYSTKQPLSNEKQLFHELVKDAMLHDHILKGAADVDAQAIDLGIQDAEH